MKPTTHRVFQWCYRAGDALNDPWPGDLAFVCGMYWYRFDGVHWHAVLKESTER